MTPKHITSTTARSPGTRTKRSQWLAPWAHFGWNRACPMAEYTVTCKSCGAVRLGNSKWIPLSAVQKAGEDCRTCGSSETVITSGWRKKKKPHEYNTEKSIYQDPAFAIGKFVGAIVVLGGPILLMALMAWVSPYFKSSSPQSDYEYCPPGLYGREC